jgi:hypothetical protein
LIRTLYDKIFVIENYISKDTCNFLANCFESRVVETERKGIFGGPSYSKGNNIKGASDGQNFLDYSNVPDYNIGVDIMAGIIERTCRTISDHYDNPYYLKSMFWSKMLTGGKNTLHMDNWYENFDGQLKPRPYNMYDRSGLLYLTDNYQGGELYFPKQDLKFKPKAGTFIFFEGNIEVPHEVLEVTGGTRCNIISFYGDANNYTLDTNSILDQFPINETQSTADSLNNIKEIIKEYDRFN